MGANLQKIFHSTFIFTYFLSIYILQNKKCKKSFGVSK